MTPRPPQRLSDYVPLSYPAIMLTLFFLVPFATMVARRRELQAEESS